MIMNMAGAGRRNYDRMLVGAPGTRSGTQRDTVVPLVGKGLDPRGEFASSARRTGLDAGEEFRG